MDIVEINKRTQSKNVKPAIDHLYNNVSITKDESLTIILHTLKSVYGINRTIKIIRGLGVKKL